MNHKTGLLLVNLGTPRSPKPRDVYRYLIEFLTDERVMDMPWLKRQLLVRGLIVPMRYRQSAHAYQQIWTDQGSPLMVFGKQVKEKLQQILGGKFCVELAMRYQEPSIQKGLDSLMAAEIDHLVVLPLFPHYASATTGSVHQKVQELLSRYRVIPKVTLIDHYATHPKLISAFCEVAKPYHPEKYDHILFSFHGLPERHLRDADTSGQCLVKSDCCQSLCRRNRNCYSAQCHATARAIVKGLDLPAGYSHTICFQSRLGKDPWIQPYTSASIAELAKQGKKRILVFCPAFVCDCLETIYEIGVEYAEEFKHAGGERLDLVPGLNAHPSWIEALRALVYDNCNNLPENI